MYLPAGDHKGWLSSAGVISFQVTGSDYCYWLLVCDTPSGSSNYRDGKMRLYSLHCQQSHDDRWNCWATNISWSPPSDFYLPEDVISTPFSPFLLRCCWASHRNDEITSKLASLTLCSIWIAQSRHAYSCVWDGGRDFIWLTAITANY